MFQNDSPIKTKIEDLLSRTSFSKKFGQAIVDWSDENSLVIALYGSWGSGKSSIINLALEYIEKEHKFSSHNKKPIIFNFNPWNFTEQNQLVSIFLKELGKKIGRYSSSEDAKKVGSELITYSKFFLPLTLIPPVAPLAFFLNQVFEKVGFVTKEWGELKSKSLEDFKEDLGKNMKKLRKKIIVVIDDIDRLNKIEVRQIFQLVKLNANFPNMIYILPFDQEKVSEVLNEESFPGRDYLEKIIQVPFQVPAVEQVKLDSIFFKEIDKLVEPLPQKYWDEKYFGNMYFGCFRKYFTSIRQVKRFANSLHFNNSHLPNELNPVDLISLEAIRVFSPEMYDAIWRNKELFTETDSGFSSNARDKEGRKTRLDSLFEKTNPQYKDITKKVIIELFPQLQGVYGNTSYGSDWQDKWNKERRVASTYRFDKYFMFSLPEGEVSQEEIDKIVRKSNNTEAIEKILIDLTKKRKIKNFLEKLSLYLDDVPEKNVEPFVLAVFNLSDKLPREKGDFGLLDTESWCVRFSYHMLLKIKDLKKRKEVFLRLIEKSKSLGIPAQLASIEVRERKGKADKSEPLIEEKDLDLFSKTILEKIKRFANNHKLLEVPNMLYILYFWKDLSSVDEPKKYVEKLISTDKGAVRLIESVVYQQSSQTIGEYVATTTWQLNPKNLETFTNLDKLKQKVNKMSKKTIAELNERQRTGLKLFIESFNLNTKSFFKALEE